MGDDHEATLEALTASREIFSNYIANHRGRIVNAPGDSILAEFSSVVDAG
jgi:adenylate cyclase